MICWDRVNELREEVGVEDFDEVVEIFLEEVEEVMERLRAEPEPLTYETELHFLKGSSLNLGFAALATICGKGEKLARGPEGGSINIQSVIQLYEQSKTEFNNGTRLDTAAE